jgi:hypothetical protein
MMGLAWGGRLNLLNRGAGNATQTARRKADVPAGYSYSFRHA